MAFVYNWTTKDFTYPWAKDLYTLKAGSVYNDVLTSDDGATKLLIVPGIANHFAKHLANREMSNNELKLPKDQRKVAWNLAVWETLHKKAIELPPSVLPAQQIASVIGTQPEPHVQTEKKRMGRPSKVSKIPPLLEALAA